MTENASQLLDLAKRALQLQGAPGGLLLSGGVINDNWRVDTAQGSYVVRIYPKGRRARQVAFEVSLHSHLRDCGCRVPAVLRPQSGANIPTARGRCVILLEYLPARPLSFDEGLRLAPARLEALLQPVDQALEHFPAPFRPVAETRVFEGRIPSLFAQFQDQPKTRDALAALFESLRQWESRIELPTRVVHADIHAGNILLQENRRLESGELWLIDFDDAHVSYRAIDWVLPALEFSLGKDGTTDESRYTEILSLLASNANQEERAAFPTLRKMMILKFAATYAQSGHRPANNPYLLHLLASELRTRSDA